MTIPKSSSGNQKKNPYIYSKVNYEVERNETWSLG